MESGTRRSNRYPLKSTVEITTPDGLVLAVDGGNLSKEGMYFSSSLISIPAYSLVEVAFSLLGKHYQLKAMVVHNHQKGMGVMFTAPQEQLYQAIRRDGVSYQPPSPLAAALYIA